MAIQTRTDKRLSMVDVSLLVKVNNPDRALKLVSMTGREYFITPEAAAYSKTLSKLITGSPVFPENETRTIEVPMLSDEVLEKTIDCLHFQLRSELDPSMATPFVFDDEMVLDLLVASDFFQM